MGRERRPLLKDIQEKRLDFSAFHGAHWEAPGSRKQWGCFSFKGCPWWPLFLSPREGPRVVAWRLCHHWSCRAEYSSRPWADSHPQAGAVPRRQLPFQRKAPPGVEKGEIETHWPLLRNSLSTVSLVISCLSPLWAPEAPLAHPLSAQDSGYSSQCMLKKVNGLMDQ